ncbi:hypothetical protein HanPI659440_Chr13g0486841 [Helianthus annuus]|nr:hypothetical protein HanPI659440_Chr13g0486841 [Helianthus annuus]
MGMMMMLNNLEKILEKKRDNTQKKRPNNRTDDDDDDFQEPINIKKMKVGKQDKVRDTTKPTKTIKLPEPIRLELRPFYGYHHEALSLRCSPSSFIETIRKFTQAQIADFKSIGFGPVLDINVNYICTHLGYWLVRNYDEQDSTLNIGNHRIKITRDSVYDVFGIPKGPNPVIEKNKPRKGAIVQKNTATEGVDTTIDEFKNQWPDRNMITHGMVADAMQLQPNGGRLFK